MKTAIKKITSLTFLAAACGPWFFMLIFFVRQQAIRHEMEEKLEEDIPLVTITLADGDIQWVKKGKEIFVHGKMFDIKKIKSANGKTTFTGLYDEQETQLKKKLQEAWQKQKAGDSQVLSRMLTSLQTLFFEESITPFVKIRYKSADPDAPDAKLTSGLTTPLTPPPQC